MSGETHCLQASAWWGHGAEIPSGVQRTRKGEVPLGLGNVCWHLLLGLDEAALGNYVELTWLRRQQARLWPALQPEQQARPAFRRVGEIKHQVSSIDRCLTSKLLCQGQNLAQVSDIPPPSFFFFQKYTDLNKTVKSRANSSTYLGGERKLTLNPLLKSSSSLER